MLRPLLEVERAPDAHADVLVLRGEVDAGSAPILRRALDPFVARGERPLLVDLSELAFIDTSGLSLLIKAQRRLIRGGRAMATVAPAGPVRRTVELAQLADTLGLHAERAAAVSSLTD